MSDEQKQNGGGWKTKAETKTCPSGQVVQIKRPGPEFTIKVGKIVQTFSRVVKRAGGDELSPEEVDRMTPQEQAKRGLMLIEKMTDDELSAYVTFARELVCAILVSPRLVLKPKPGSDEIGPDEIPDSDFWWLFHYSMSGHLNLTVPVGPKQEVKVADLTSFREESGVSGDRDNGAEVRTNAEQLA